MVPFALRTTAFGATGLRRYFYLAMRKRKDIWALSNPADVADLLRGTVKKGDWKPIQADGDSAAFDVAAIFATAETVTAIGSNFTPIPIPPGVIWADGNGDGIAYGAAHALMSLSARRAANP